MQYGMGQPMEAEREYQTALHISPRVYRRTQGQAGYV